MALLSDAQIDAAQALPAAAPRPYARETIARDQAWVLAEAGVAAYNEARGRACADADASAAA